MFRVILSFLIAAAACAASTPEPTEAPVVMPNTKNIYPYVVPAEYLLFQPMSPAGLTRKLGNGLFVVLVHDQDGLVGNVVDTDLTALKLTPEAAYDQAIKNLEKLFKSGEIKTRVFPNGPHGQSFILAGGHWAAATAILLPELRGIAMGALKVDSICVSIPHREAMLIFPKGDSASREEFRKIIRERESDGRKPLTFELFELTADGVVELKN
jgi:hypothetical protein